MITFASMKDIEELRQIWQECFHDKKEYIDFFFSSHPVEETTLVYRQDGHAVAMLNLLPGALVYENTRIPIRYVYAVATLTEHRGKGIARMLLKQANEMLCSQGIATVLVPAMKELFHYYERQGYQTAFYIKESGYTAVEEESEISAASIEQVERIARVRQQESMGHLTLKDISAESYKRIRDRHFKADGYVEWGIREIEYAIRENALLGGETKKLIVNNREEILMYYINEDTLTVKETTLSNEIQIPVLRDLAAMLKCKGFSVRSSKDDMMTGSLRPFGMIYGLNEDIFRNREIKFRNDYLNLVLD